jgi:hypothetical protein
VVPKFVAYLAKALEFERKDNDAVEGSTELLIHVAESQDLSLRAIERIMTTLAIGLAYSPPDTIRPSPILGGLSILKVVRPDLYAKAKKGQLQYDEVQDALGFEDQSSTGDSLREWYVKWWQFCTGNNLTEEETQRFGESLWRYHIERQRIVPHVANAIIDRLTPGK